MKTEKDILEIAGRFNLGSGPVKAKAWGNGLINDTLLVTSEDGTRYILQRINTAIFTDPALLQDNLKKITGHIRRRLAAKGESDIDRKVLTPVDTAGGEAYAMVDGEAWRMTRFIEGSHTVETVTPEMAFVTGRAFAAFHDYFAGDDAPQLSETIPDFHNVGFRITQLRDAARADSAGRLDGVKDIVEYLLSRADEMLLAERLHSEGKLPRRVAHCDTKVNNILFDADGNILCVIDLDTTMPGFILSDFGDFIRTAGNTGAEDDPDLSRVGVDMEIFRSFARGYVGAAPFLTATERELLPFGARMLTYMQTVRFLTDYLNGDTYYKIRYPDHNLVRTRAQLRLLADLDAHAAEMDDFIKTL